MTVTGPAPAGATSLVERVKAILLSPATEWGKIEAEPATERGLFTGYAMVLAAIAAIAQLVGELNPVCLWVCFRPNPLFAVVSALVYYLASLAGVYVVALVADELATNFGGQKNRIQALKLIVYAWTAAWLAGVFAIVPALAILSLVGLYSFYLMYVGAPKLMKVPEDKAVAYTAVTSIVGIVIVAVIMTVLHALSGFGMVRPPPAVIGTVNIGGTSVDLGKVQQATQQLQAAANQIQAQQNGQPAPAGSIKAVAPDALKALLPDSLSGGYARTEVEASGGAAAGVSGSTAQGTYTKGAQNITLKVTDMAAMGALASLGGAVDIQSDKQTATGYEKVGKVDGRLTEESFDHQSKSGRYSVMVANRFMVEAQGEGADMGDLKGAVSAVGLDKLEGMAHG
jgi:hypothetical protein